MLRAWTHDVLKVVVDFSITSTTFELKKWSWHGHGYAISPIQSTLKTILRWIHWIIATAAIIIIAPCHHRLPTSPLQMQSKAAAVAVVGIDRKNHPRKRRRRDHTDGVPPVTMPSLLLLPIINRGHRIGRLRQHYQPFMQKIESPSIKASSN